MESAELETRPLEAKVSKDELLDAVLRFVRPVATRERLAVDMMRWRERTPVSGYKSQASQSSI